MNIGSETLESLISKASEANLCKHYQEYDIEVQQMVEKLYKATYRVGLFKSQIIYILDEALTPFKKGGK